MTESPARDAMDDEQRATVARAESAPPPDDPRKPQRVAQIAPSSWWYVFRRSSWKFLVNLGMDAAGALTYYSILSIFPALLALVSALGVIGQGRAATTWLVGFLSRHAPKDVVDLLSGPIQNLATERGAGIVLIVSLVIAVWSASGYVAAFGRTCNQIYGVAEGRPLWKIIPYNLLLTILTLAFGAIAMLTVLMSGNVARVIGDAVGLGAETQQFWGVAKWPLLALAAVVYTSLIYYATPNVRQPRFRWVTVGSVLALLVMAVAVVVFTQYVISFGTFNATYGVIGSVTVLLLGLWMVNVALVFGAEVDAELERVRELQGGIEAEDHIQLPPRDERMIVATAEAQQKFVDEARAIRERYAGVDYGGSPPSPAPRRGRRQR